MSAADLDLRLHLGNVLNRSLPVESFRQWFASALWELKSVLDDDTLDFAYLIENRIAERSSGLITDDELIEALASDFESKYLLPSPVASRDMSDEEIVTAGNATTGRSGGVVRSTSILAERHIIRQLQYSMPRREILTAGTGRFQVARYPLAVGQQPQGTIGSQTAD